MNFGDVNLDEVVAKNDTEDCDLMKDNQQEANVYANQPEAESLAGLLFASGEDAETSQSKDEDEEFGMRDEQRNSISSVQLTSPMTDSSGDGTVAPLIDERTDTPGENGPTDEEVPPQGEIEPTLIQYVGSDPKLSGTSSGDLDENDERLYSMSGGLIIDHDTAQDETQSAFSDSSSDSDGWDMDAELARASAETADIVFRMNERKEAANEADIYKPRSAEADSNNELGSEGQPDSNAQEPSATEEFRDETRPWLRNAISDGALLPMGGYRDDEKYRRDIRFFYTGNGDCSRRTSRNPNAQDKPSLLSHDGTLERLHKQLNQERQQRYQIADDFDIVQGELTAANAVLKEDQEQIDMLKHAVDRRDQALEQYKDAVKVWQKHSEQWQTAFHEQRPLADAERERQMLIEQGHDSQQDANTQTSPIELSAQSTTEKIPSGDSGTQTDVEPLDADALADLTRERDDLRFDSEKMSAQVQRLASLLNENKEWIEDREWKLKGDTETNSSAANASDTTNLAGLVRERDKLMSENSTLSAQVDRLANLLNDSKEWIESREWKLKAEIKEASPTADNSSHAVDRPRAIRTPRRTPAVIVEETTYSEIELPPTSKMLGWPEHWAEREEDLRQSASWRRARDTAAAELNAWTNQVWANAIGIPAVFA